MRRHRDPLNVTAHRTGSRNREGTISDGKSCITVPPYAQEITLPQRNDKLRCLGIQASGNGRANNESRGSGVVDVEVHRLR
ncbi:MAG: hypothetical protein WC314_07400 [Vulcanimicrobiota bacterium]